MGTPEAEGLGDGRLVPSKKLKMYFYSLHYLIAALKSKLGMNLFQSH